MSEKKGFFPWLKSIFHRGTKNPAEGVYAGPERFNRNEEPVKCVYAGPEYFRNRQKNGSEMKEVYAGPELFEPERLEEAEAAEEPPAGEKTPEEAPEIKETRKRAFTGRVYAGPPPRPVECVYAGPEYFHAEPEKPVYAGPEYFGEAPESERPEVQIPPEGPIMMAYAGPRFMNGGIGVMAPAKEEEKPEEKAQEPVELAPGEVICPACGAKVTGSFCPECGTPRPEGEA